MSNGTTRTRAERIEGIARVIPRLCQPTSRAEASQRLCDAARELTGCAAAALFLDDGVLLQAALSGFTLDPPDRLPASLAAEELAALASWGQGVGLGPVEMCVLRLDEHELGLLALFGGNVEPLRAEDLDLLGAVAAHALEQARLIDDLRRAYETQERTQDQMMRTERLRVLGEMALGIAHDFNNVLNAVLGQVGVLEIMCLEKRELHVPLDRLKRIALDGAGTIGRLQDFSRQRRDQEFDEVNLTSVVQAAASSVRDQRFPHLAVDVRLEPGILVAGASGDLREVVNSVLANAREACAERIVLRLDHHEDEARLSITDDGSGMSREVRKRAFDPFFTTKGSLASGLGLSVAYGIVRRHGGRIDLESTPGRGCTVQIRLPVMRAEAPSRPTFGPDFDVARTGAVHILLVEDDADNREAMATLLGLGGYVVTAADSGGEGVRRFATARFDFVLTDLGLPDMTGWELARHVKDASPQTPVALITGWGLNLARDEIRRRGVDVLIKKPIEPRRFLEQLAAMGLGPQPLVSHGVEEPLRA